MPAAVFVVQTKRGLSILGPKRDEDADDSSHFECGVWSCAATGGLCE